MPERCLIVGLGNPILGDDGVGWRIADEVMRHQSRVGPHIDLDVECVALGGLRLMERLIGYDRAIILDAIHTGRDPPGTVSRLSLDELSAPVAGYSNASHDTSLRTALDVGRVLGAQLPEHVTIIAVETAREFSFSEALTPPVALAVPRAAALALDILSQTDPWQEEAHHGVP